MSNELEDAPRVSVGGQEWPIPQLAAKQNRIIDPLILSLLPVFNEWQTDKAHALSMLGGPQYEALQEICYQAIRKARPELMRDQFLDLPVTLPELIAAFPVIAQQTGVFKRGEPGEAQAGTDPQRPQTGTESSPTSAT
jgi:hypothetical protein